MESSNICARVYKEINVPVNVKLWQGKTALDVGPSVKLVEATFNQVVSSLKNHDSTLGVHEFNNSPFPGYAKAVHFFE